MTRRKKPMKAHVMQKRSNSRLNQILNKEDKVNGRICIFGDFEIFF